RGRAGPQERARAEDVAVRAAAALEGAQRLAELQSHRGHDARRLAALELSHRIAAALQREERTGPGLQSCAEVLRRELGARAVRIWAVGEARQLLKLQATSTGPLGPQLPLLE